jgi:hypothetical protein
MSNPVDEYLKIKTSNKSWGGELAEGAANVFSGKNIGHVAASSALLAGGAGLASAAGKIMTAITKKRDFNAMMQHAPDLANYQEKNPEQFNRHYSSFRSMNPKFAKDPVVAATYMRQMSEYPESAGKHILESLSQLPKGGRGIEHTVKGDHFSTKL